MPRADPLSSCMMSRPAPQRSSGRNGVDLTNSSTASHHRKSIPTLFKSHRPTKKQISLSLNKADFELCQAPDDTEMLGFMQSSNGESDGALNRSGSTTSDDTVTERPYQNGHSMSPTTPRKNRLLSNLKFCLAPHKYDAAKTDEEKNRGFVLVDPVDGDSVLISNENNDQQHTRHPEPCAHEHVAEETLDLNQIQLMSTTPVTPSLLPPQQPTTHSSSLLPLMNDHSSELDMQATQAGVECATPGYEEPSVHDTQVSATNSSTSTNSSNNDQQYMHTDRSTLSDIDYVIEQKRDLERITIYEIALNNDRRDYQQDLPQNENDEIDFELRYKDAREENLKFKNELKQLQEEKARVYSPWSCEVCTYINEPYIKTRRDVCEMCEGPSPRKRHTLTS